MGYGCQVLGHYFAIGCYLHQRDDGGQEWRQDCARCPTTRTVNPELRSDAVEWADSRYAEMGERVREKLRSYLASER